MSKKIIIVSGVILNSINSEIIFKSWKKLEIHIKKENILYFKCKLIKKTI